MSRFLLKLVLLLPLLLGMAWVNWSVDPAILFVEHQADPSRHPYENLVARDLLAGRPHRLKTGCSEFLLDELVFRGRPQIDTLVLGTSIAKPIHEGLFGSPQFWNASVTGGRIEEMIVAYQLALDCGLHPRHALIEIDGRSLGQPAHVPPSKVLRKAFRRLGLPDETQSESIWKMAWDAIVPGREAAGPANEHGPFYPYDELVSPVTFSSRSPVSRTGWAPAKRSQEPASQFGEANEALIYPDGSLDWWNNGAGPDARDDSPEIRRATHNRDCRRSVSAGAPKVRPVRSVRHGPRTRGGRGRVRALAAESLVLRTGRGGVEASRKAAPLPRDRGGHSLDGGEVQAPGARLA